METFTLSTAILTREDLNIYEKMCCVVLAHFASEAPNQHYTLGTLAQRMGCREKEAKKAVESLRKKEILLAEHLELEELPTKKTKVIKKAESAPKAVFESFGVPAASPKKKPAELLVELRSFILEPVTDGTLRIVLNMAGGDVERIRMLYQEAVANSGTDIFEYLMHHLQNEGPQDPENTGSTEPDLQEGTKKVLTQINQQRIAELYRNSKKKDS